MNVFVFVFSKNPLKLAYEIVETEHESIDCQYSPEMNDLLNSMLQKVTIFFQN
jgi:hypothetical protein